MRGTVITVSADRLIDQKTGAAYYDAQISLDEGEIERIKGLDLLPGMPVEVMITTGETTLLNYLVQPFTDLLRFGVTES